MKITEHSWQRLHDGWYLGMAVRIGRCWVRFAAAYGQPAGSHIGVWRTRWGDLRGLNLRIGKRYIGPALTVLLHTRREEPK